MYAYTFPIHVCVFISNFYSALNVAYTLSNMDRKWHFKVEAKLVKFFNLLSFNTFPLRGDHQTPAEQELTSPPM